MHIDYTPEQRTFREKLRAYLSEVIDEGVQLEVRDNGGGGALYHATMQRMGRDGWLGVSWPKEHGGQERPAVEQWIFFQEVLAKGFPLPFLTLNTVGPTLAKFGTELQRERFLHRILEGKCHFSIGYTEPNAGTDLASLTTKAIRDGDDWLITGQKMFTSLASYADYIWLAVRTDPEAPKHKGISIFIVDTKLPGVQITPIKTIGGHDTYATYYEEVRVSNDMLVGELNAGWKLITNQLNHERVALSGFGHMARNFDDTCDWARQTTLADGQRLIDLPWVQSNLARVYSYLETTKLLAWRQACNVDAGVLDPAESSAVKVYSSERFMEVYRLLLEVAGADGVVRRGFPDAVIGGWLESMYRNALVLTFGGGTNEAQRDIISMAGLGMPRGR